jgi:DNA-binding transcriptional ArsR family regulator
LRIVSIGLVDIYRSFADPTRLRILNLLLQRPLCVCHIQEVLDLPQVNTSQHLAYLRKAGIVAFERMQTWKIYRLNHSGNRNLQLCLKCLSNCVKTDPIFSADILRLQKALRKSDSPDCRDGKIRRVAKPQRRREGASNR